MQRSMLPCPSFSPLLQPPILLPSPPPSPPPSHFTCPSHALITQHVVRPSHSPPHTAPLTQPPPHLPLRVDAQRPALALEHDDGVGSRHIILGQAPDAPRLHLHGVALGSMGGTGMQVCCCKLWGSKRAQSTIQFSSPDAPLINPDAPLINPDAPLISPDAPLINPDAPLIQPRCPVDQPRCPVDSSCDIQRHQGSAHSCMRNSDANILVIQWAVFTHQGVYEVEVWAAGDAVGGNALAPVHKRRCSELR